MDMYDYIKFEKSEKAFLSICSELLELRNLVKIINSFVDNFEEAS